MKFALIPKEVKAQMTTHDERLEKGKLYPVIYTREDTYPNGSKNVVVALAEYDKPVKEYPISWFSIEDYEVATSEQE
jgi:hypothetical protein